VVLTNRSSVAAPDPSGLGPLMYDVSLRPGVNAQSFWCPASVDLVFAGRAFGLGTGMWVTCINGAADESLTWGNLMPKNTGR
jgi:hypothetical protein